MDMNDVFTRLNMLLGGAAALMSYLLGVHWYVFAAYFVLQAVDYCTGSAKAKAKGEESSSKGMQGIKKKVYYWVLIGLSFLAPYVLIHAIKDLFGVDLTVIAYVGWFTTLTMFINECRSILENLYELGVPVTGFLTKGLEIAEKALKKEDDPD